MKLLLKTLLALGLFCSVNTVAPYGGTAQAYSGSGTNIGRPGGHSAQAKRGERRLYRGTHRGVSRAYRRGVRHGARYIRHNASIGPRHGVRHRHAHRLAHRHFRGHTHRRYRRGSRRFTPHHNDNYYRRRWSYGTGFRTSARRDIRP
jgi:hypothetical protein